MPANWCPVSINEEAESLVSDVIPKKMQEIFQLCKSAQLSVQHMKAIQAGSKLVEPKQVIDLYVEKISLKTRSTEAGPQLATPDVKPSIIEINFPANNSLIEIEDKLRPFAYHIVDMASTLKLWITVHIPKVEDGHNFGVSVQEDVLGEISDFESRANAFFEIIHSYRVTRAHLVKRFLKYPHIEDFRNGIVALDEKHFTDLISQASLFRECYVSLHRMITLNLDKLKNPRPHSSSNMY
ncbi:hypothetical protein GJ496_004186 [Pomphorhynchus laevis]|nr:hypothetical protein GJ496_004186 [Pomphorhynchus laevis]